LQFRLNRPSRCARYALRHAHTGCPPPKTHAADASAARRRSHPMALEPQPHPGALAAAAAGPAGRAVETPSAAAAALSHAPGIGAGDPPGQTCLAWPWRASRSAAPSQTTPPHGAMQRGRRWRGKSGGPPPPSRADTSAAKPRFSVQITGRIRRGRVEPFSLPPDITLPGTLHHSGIRPAPPSDYTPLVRRSAFQPQWKRSRRGNSDASAGLKRL
jgi:hypothetical protein